MPFNSHKGFWKGKRVWISGHTGFKGSWLALWLLHLGAIVEGYALDPIDDGGPSLFNSLGLETDLAFDQRGDLLDLELLLNRFKSFKPQIVFHLAAQPLVKRGYREPLLTWNTNVIGTCHVLEALRKIEDRCVAVMVTTDKVYENREWDYAYRESDPLGGHDPYSSSKAAAEIAIASWRSSFCGDLKHQQSQVRVLSARAGNVIGGGDWAENRIVPDAVRALINSKPIGVRSPRSIRPWQHVLEPLGAYIQLAEMVYENEVVSGAFNFGPDRNSNRTVKELVEEILSSWSGSWIDQSDPDAPHEALRLDLSTDRAFHQMRWSPTWNFQVTISETINWYKRFHDGESARKLCIDQIERFTKA